MEKNLEITESGSLLNRAFFSSESRSYLLTPDKARAALRLSDACDLATSATPLAASLSSYKQGGNLLITLFSD